MNLEGGHDERESGFLGRLGNVPGVRETIVAAELLVAEPALRHLGDLEQVHAAEIAPNAPWKDGLKELFNSADKELVEVKAYFLQTNDGQTHWVKPMSGMTTGIPNTMLRRHLSDEESKIRAFVEGKRAEVCSIHTHSKESIRIGVTAVLRMGVPSALERMVQDIDFERPLSLPPSANDIAFAFGPDEVVGMVNRANAVATSRKDAVVDPLFISYTQLFESPSAVRSFQQQLKTPTDTASVADVRITTAQLRWLSYVNNSKESPKAMLSSRAYDELRAAYASVNVQLRLVDKTSVDNEPPCAGARY